MRLAQPFPQWVAGDEIDEIACELRMFAEVQSDAGEVLDGDESHFVEAGDRGQGERLVGEVGESRTAPKGKSVDEEVGGGAQIVRASSLRGQGLETMGVECVARHGEPIPGRRRDDQSARAWLGVVEGASQLGDLG